MGIVCEQACGIHQHDLYVFGYFCTLWSWWSLLCLWDTTTGIFRTFAMARGMELPSWVAKCPLLRNNLASVSNVWSPVINPDWFATVLHIGFKDDKERPRGSTIHVLLLCACVTVSRGYKYNIPSPKCEQNYPTETTSWSLTQFLHLLYQMCWSLAFSLGPLHNQPGWTYFWLNLIRAGNSWNGIVTCSCIVCMPAKWALRYIHELEAVFWTCSLPLAVFCEEVPFVLSCSVSATSAEYKSLKPSSCLSLWHSGDLENNWLQ